MIIDAREHSWQAIGDIVRNSVGDVKIISCCGERFIGSALRDRTITIEGVPGNALGAYMNGGTIICDQNVQDAVGDTMNDGKIIVHGSAGDALGYSMRGGKIFVKENSGYRTGIHMKQYMEKRPVIVIGGKTGSFLGEYLAGGLIIVLGIGAAGVPSGAFIGTGMHGGEIWLRSAEEPTQLPAQVCIERAEDCSEIREYIAEYAELFDVELSELCSGVFWKLTPNAKNPYKSHYTHN